MRQCHLILSVYVDADSKRDDLSRNLKKNLAVTVSLMRRSKTRECTVVEEGCQSRTKGVKQSLEWVWHRSRARARGHKGQPVQMCLAVVFQCHIVPRACFPIPLHTFALEARQQFCPAHQRSLVHLAADALLLEIKQPTLLGQRRPRNRSHNLKCYYLE